MARAAGLNIVESIDDSWSFGFLGSELYRRNVSCGDFHSWPFSTTERDRAAQRAHAANEAKRGDQVAVLLTGRPIRFGTAIEFSEHIEGN
jgi:hypothetical protein